MEAVERIETIQFDDLDHVFVSTIHLPDVAWAPAHYEVVAMRRGPAKILYMLRTTDRARAARAHGLFLLRTLRTHGAG